MYGFLGFIILLAGFLFQAILHNTGRIQSDYGLFIFILVSACFLIYDLASRFSNRMRYAIVLASVVRFLIMLWNVYGRNVLLLPGVGTDTEGFYASAVLIGQNLDLLNASLYGEYYAKYLGLLFHFTGPSYLLGSYLNYIYGLLAIRFVNDIVQQHISVDDSVYTKGMYIFAFAPISMILFSSLRREGIMILFAVMSLKMLFQWAEIGKNRFAFLAVVFLLLSSVFHAGMIGLSLGYIFLFLFYYPERKSYGFTIRSVGVGLLIVLISFVIVNEYSSLFLNKLMFSDEDILYNRMTRARGGAAYLTSLQISSIQEAILYSPLKVFYFLLSPVPWDWRNGADAVAFMFDAMLYLYLITSIVINYYKSDYPTKFGIILSLLGSLILYAMASQNAANAMRHRSKLLAVIIILYYIVKRYKEEEKHPRSLK